MKQTIRINESQLRRMVAESVKNVLNEIDWKTYQNAAKKARERGDNRQSKFMSAAADAFNDEYGWGEEGFYDPKVHYDGMHLRATNNDPTQHTMERMYDYDSENGTYSNPRNYDSTKAFGLFDKYDKDGRYKRVWNPSLSRYFEDPEQEKAYRRASKEMDDYKTGKYVYDKEKGWHLKDK